MPVASATLPVMAAALPFWLAGFWRPFDMKLEEFLPLLADHRLNAQHMQYRPCGAVIWPAPAAKSPKQKCGQRRSFKKKGGELYEPSKEQTIARAAHQKDMFSEDLASLVQGILENGVLHGSVDRK